MTVAELRRDLMKFDPNAEIMIDSRANSYPLETLYGDANEYVYLDEDLSKEWNMPKNTVFIFAK